MSPNQQRTTFAFSSVYINQSSMVQGYPGVLPAHATAAAQRAYRKHVAGGGDQPSRPLPLGS